MSIRHSERYARAAAGRLAAMSEEQRGVALEAMPKHLRASTAAAIVAAAEKEAAVQEVHDVKSHLFSLGYGWLETVSRRVVAAFLSTADVDVAQVAIEEIEREKGREELRGFAEFFRGFVAKVDAHLAMSPNPDTSGKIAAPVDPPDPDASGKTATGEAEQ